MRNVIFGKDEMCQPQNDENAEIKNAFFIQRREKNYSRSAVDITLEQTVNRDAASSSRGVVAFQNSESAIRRWSRHDVIESNGYNRIESLHGDRNGRNCCHSNSFI